MSRPANGTGVNSNSSASGHSDHHGVSMPGDAADRLLQHRLAALMDSPPITVSLPPPSAAQLEDRLARLSGPKEAIPDEEELQRRFDRLHSAQSAGGSTSFAASSAVPLYSASQLALAGATRPRSEQEEIDELIEQARLHAELERAHGQPAPGNNRSTPSAQPTLAQGPSASVARSVAGISTRAPSSSPPLPATSAEIQELMRELQTMPDTAILDQAHRMTQAHKQRAGKPNASKAKGKGKKKNKHQSDSDSDDESDSTSDGSSKASGSESEDALVDDIIRQAQDEARMGL